MNAKLFIFVAATAIAASNCFADKAAELKPTLAKAGKLVAEDAFSASSLAKVWSVGKGDWQVSDGQLAGKEKATDNHAAVLMLGKPNHNSIIQFSFKLDGAKGVSLSYNHAKGHLFRIGISESGLVINKDKDKKDEKSKGAVLGKGTGKFETGKWYTMMVEVQGDKVSVQTDNGIKAAGSHKELDVDKTGYRFVARGSTLALDDIKVWEVAP
jgi:co-chaperonin GroES (HSP10)